MEQVREHRMSGDISISNLLLSPNEFLDHVRSLGLESIVMPFLHYQARPLPSSAGGRYDDNVAQQWCDRMDTLLVHFTLTTTPSAAYCYTGEAGSCYGVPADSQGLVHGSQ